MIINHNMNAMNAHRMMTGNNVNSGKSMEKLSSGLRINRAGDDAAGLAISEKMRAQIKGLDQSSRNSQDSISMIQTAEGALNETHAILQRMRELSVQAANDTNVTKDRDSINDEITQLKGEIDRISNNTEFNTRKLLNGDLSQGTTAKTQLMKVASGVIQQSGANTLVGASKLTGLEDASGNDLGLQVGDSVTIRATKNGSIICASVTISSNATMSAILSAIKTSFTTSASITGGAIQLKTTTGSAAALGAVTITASDASGTERTAFNNAFGSIAQTQKAQDASANGSTTMQIGANQGQTLAIDINKMDSTSLGVNAVSVATTTAAQVSITAIDEAITSVSSERSKLGAVQNRLEHTIANLNTASENLQASESRIRDVDMAKEMMSFSKNNILSQAAQAMLAQANQQPQGVLQLLR